MERLISSLAWAAVAASVLVLTAAGRSWSHPGHGGSPLVLSGTQGIVAMSFRPDATASHSGRPLSNQKAAKLLARWSSALVRAQVAAALPGVKATKALKPLEKQGARLSLQQTKASGRIALLGLYTAVASPGTTLDETQAVSLTLNGKTYSVTLDRKASKKSGKGAVVQVDYASLPDSTALDGSLFAALVRETSAPSVGVLFLGVYDTALPTLLAEFGLTNTNRASGTPVNVPFDLSLTGSSSGEHTAEGALFGAVYFARQDAFGLAVPQELSDAAADLVADLAGGH